jgi:hypothetical protein
MRRAQRQHQKERVLVILNEGAGVVCLRERVVSGPVFRRWIVPFVIERVVVLVRAFARLPIAESEALLGRDVREPPSILAVGAAVKVPFADEAGRVSGAAERLGQRGTVRLQLHIVDEDAVGERILPRHQAGAKRAANGATRNCGLKIDALGGQAIEHRSA